MLILNSGQI